MDDILIAPDIHGRNFWEPALDFKGEVIFLGDYVDPYPQEGLKPADAYGELLKVVDLKRKNPGRVTLLIGNHELHYIDRNMGAGRFSEEYYERFHEILTGRETAGLFRLCKQVGRYFFVHAGLTKGWYELHKKQFINLGDSLEERLNAIFAVNKGIFYEASFYRGGWDDFSSPLWTDLREIMDEEKTGHFDDSIVQVFGHTQLMTDEPYILGNGRFYCLDNRRLYILHDDVIEPY
ncbi:MAG: metallophosphoesterase [Tannerella sp.]|jgi:hypothetical protein|nr:metallophosphoesterase [Tannerella sp.]